MAELTVSVIIPVYNDSDGLARCLEALSRQTLPADDFEVLVVDNGSERDLRPCLAAAPRAVLLQARKLGSYAARNEGLRRAKGAILAFTDADCRPRPDWLERARARILADPDVGLIGGRIEIHPENREHPRLMELYEMALAMVQEDLVRDRGFAATANMITTRRTIDLVGPFDETLQSGGDAEWGQRVGRAGLRVEYADDVIIDHPARSSIAAVFRKLRRVATGPQAAARATAAEPASFRRGVLQKLDRHRRRTRDWSTAARCKSLIGAALAEAMMPVAKLELRFRGSDRRL